MHRLTTPPEHELLSIMEMLKEYRNILLGHKIEVFTDHKNLVYKHFNTERVMHWCLVLEEFGPTLTHTKGEHNVVAETLSRLELTEEEFSSDAFAGNQEDSPEDFPFSYAVIAQEQHNDPELIDRHNSSELYDKTVHKHADKQYEPITQTDTDTNQSKIMIPKSPHNKITKWYHLHLLHHGETRMELTIGQHFYWKGIRASVTRVCKNCTTCKGTKARNKKYGLLLPKDTDVLPWHTLCIDLVGPYTAGKDNNEVKLHCLTMIDPATGWFEIAEIPNRRADCISNFLEWTWLTCCPWPTEVVFDRGSEFQAELSAMLKNEYKITKKVITTRNPQANSMVEHVHQVIHQLICSMCIAGNSVLDDEFGWAGILSAI